MVSPESRAKTYENILAVPHLQEAKIPECTCACLVPRSTLSTVGGKSSFQLQKAHALRPGRCCVEPEMKAAIRKAKGDDHGEQLHLLRVIANAVPAAQAAAEEAREVH